MLLPFLIAYAVLAACALVDFGSRRLWPALEAWMDWQREAASQVLPPRIDPLSGRTMEPPFR
jgi:hypothetical protein